MAVTLPTAFALDRLVPRLISARAELNAASGGSTQRIARLGSRWAFDVAIRPQRLSCAYDWTDLLTEADTCIFELPEPGIDMNGAGSPLVNGGSQAGSSLITDGWTPQFYIPKGKRLSVSVGGLLYSYKTTAAVIANSLGAATLPILPMLRASPANNAVVNINPVTVEGFVDVDPDSLAYDRNGIVTALAFTLKERR